MQPPGPDEVLPEAKWSGVLKVGSIEVRCFVLEDGTRLFDAEDVQKLFTTEGLTVEDFGEMANWMKGK